MLANGTPMTSSFAKPWGKGEQYEPWPASQSRTVHRRSHSPTKNFGSLGSLGTFGGKRPVVRATYAKDRVSLPHMATNNTQQTPDRARAESPTKNFGNASMVRWRTGRSASVASAKRRMAIADAVRAAENEYNAKSDSMAAIANSLRAADIASKANANAEAEATLPAMTSDRPSRSVRIRVPAPARDYVIREVKLSDANMSATRKQLARVHDLQPTLVGGEPGTNPRPSMTRVWRDSRILTAARPLQDGLAYSARDPRPSSCRGQVGCFFGAPPLQPTPVLHHRRSPTKFVR